ncbi:MAG: GTPase ObgE [Desulfatiglandales bacterium]
MIRFLDEAVITVQSGDGGRGCISFRKEKFIPRGGPDGGDGGDGGGVILKATNRLHTLIDFNTRKHFRAQNGAPGRGKNQSGKDGKDVVIEVPLGTLIYEHDTGGVLADLVQNGQQIVILQGGKGGRGNQHFATPTNRAPRYAQPGLPGSEIRLRLSLKYLADIGIIGLPNAGKSTLLSRLTMARPKIDNYPFSTLTPNLGVMTVDDERVLTVADIPGLIEGASQGRGLGHRFLKHVERTLLLVHVIDATANSADKLLDDFLILRDELQKYNASLLQKRQLVVFNKIDLLPPEMREIEQVRRTIEDKGVECLAISALTGDGLDVLKQVLAKKLTNGN